MNAQSRGALKKANELRLAGAKYRHELAELPYTEALSRAASLLDDPPDGVQRLRVDNFLKAIPNFGPAKTHQILRDLAIPPVRHVGPVVNTFNGRRALTERQRQCLAEELRRRAV